MQLVQGNFADLCLAGLDVATKQQGGLVTAFTLNGLQDMCVLFIGRVYARLEHGRWTWRDEQRISHMLADPDARVRQTAAQKLGNVGPSDPAAFPALLASLQDGDADVRCTSILALLKFGPKARDAVPALAEIRERDPDARVRDHAAKALARIESPASPK